MIPPYPFAAVVGLADLRLALLLTAVSPAVGGVLVRGEKGTAKSTVVRALASLLPEVDVVRGCRFACDPAAPDASCPDGPHADPDRVTRRSTLVELPVGATEDRVIGSLDLQRALGDGVRAYEPGLLAAAHRGVLYVDEVNLLPDHLVDLLLDAAAMGRAHVERDGVSVQHAARFLLVGTMNPEEGEPRPQLVDRFGLVVSVSAPDDPAQRAEVVRRRLAYEADPAGFAARWAGEDAAIAGRIATARGRLHDVRLPDTELDRIARICLAYGVDGLRADIVIARAAIALAAWHGRTEVTPADVADAARLALPHRRRRDPLDPPGTDEQRLDEVLEENRPDPDDDPPPGGGGPSGPSDDGPDQGGPDQSGPSDAAPDDRGVSQEENGQRRQPAPVGAAYRPKALRVPGRGVGGPSGKRSSAYARTGRVVGSRLPAGRLTSVHLSATIRAAAARGSRRVGRPDLREAVHVGREANLVLFVVDASGSMAARQRMRTVKTAVLSLLRDAYQRRDKIGMITFRGAGAQPVLEPTTSHEVGVARLKDLRTGGRTPLAEGLRAAVRTLAAERRRDPHRRPLLVVVTDGRATSGADPLTVAPALAGTAAVVVDCESGPVRLGLAKRLAAALDADHIPLEALDATTIRRAA
ncbi:VWA domain-containing protein [Planosporangium mesophilum]|uniref:Mg-protoporphyrin IX chelatase n=1 Tax=Planosporangium mesophilum TaxID=689768 RepID=A0A8J3T9F2_9ACTN|nr:VWA domain-containing protein [Planosporangium mesophilum]NJC86067.1 VWA domain-containing protein [Planosporangium mesophilum]GII21496.1 magnesium chelatase [Planosporangium mesophilum]